MNPPLRIGARQKAKTVRIAARRALARERVAFETATRRVVSTPQQMQKGASVEIGVTGRIVLVGSAPTSESFLPQAGQTPSARNPTLI